MLELDDDAFEQSLLNFGSMGLGAGLGGGSFGALAGMSFPRGDKKKKKNKKKPAKKNSGMPGSPNNGLGEFGL